MLNDITALTRKLMRKHYARWSKFEDALERIRSVDGEMWSPGSKGRGEQARRLLANARRVRNYPRADVDSLQSDRAITMSKLAGPLSEVMGHLVTLELIEVRMKELQRVENERVDHRDDRFRDGYYREQIPLLEALHEFGVAHGNYRVLSREAVNAIARYIKRKVDARLADLPPLRTDRSKWKHTFWDAYRVPGKPR
jgi:hypothetical protein